jgi:N-acetylneuraminic acid mutarotase
VNTVLNLSIVVASMALVPLVGGADGPYAPQPQDTLKPMLAIQWKKGPNLPQGFQDSAGGILHDTLVTVGGFCSGHTGVPGKAATYPRGFLDKVWGLNLQSPETRWQDLPNFPGAARQGLFAIVVHEQLCCWGGFSYAPPYSYKDGYRLSRREGKWQWDRLPELPWLACSSGICAVGSKIYVVGGSDYDGAGEGRFYTETDRTGKVKRLGARLLTIDTKNLHAGWRELAPCPGTPRFTPAAAAVAGNLYLIGGATGNDNPCGHYCTVVDNWQYDPAADSWQRIADTPVASGNFPSGQIVAFDRYIVLVGGYQYAKVLGPDGLPKPPYGAVGKHYPNHEYCSDVFVYDVKRGKFGTGTPLPLNNNGPMTVVAGDSIHLIGGETGGATIDGEPFGHHPDLYLVGTIRKTNR